MNFATGPDANYLNTTFGGLNCLYQINEIGGLTPTISKNTSLEYSKANLSATIVSCSLETLKMVIKDYNESILAIGSTLGWTPLPEETDIPTAFSTWIQKQNLEDFKKMNLSNLGIKLLPPQMQLFKKLEHLDLSDNQLCYLLPELQLLPLKILNISGNSALQQKLPKWLKKKPELSVIAQKMGFNFIPKGFTPDRFLCDSEETIRFYHSS